MQESLADNTLIYPIAALRHGESQRWLPHLESVDLPDERLRSSGCIRIDETPVQVGKPIAI
jgi:hypothetical protein